MATEQQTQDPPDFVKIGEGLAAGASNVVTLSRWQTALVVALRAAVASAFGFLLGLFGTVANWVARGLVEGENEAEGTLTQLQATALSDLLGVNINPAALRARGNGSGRGAAGDAMGAAIINALIPRSGSIEPGEAAAQRYVSAVTKFGLEGWLSGFTVEFLSSMWGPFGHLETFGELDDILAQSLGFGRLSQRVLRPYVDTLIVTPVEWQVNKLYRPRLLSPAEAVRQHARGRMDAGQLAEELGRQGYSDLRIEALINAARKFSATAELYLLYRYGLIDRAQFIEHLRDQGYEQADAEREFTIERLKRIDSYERSLANVIVDAFADRRITPGDFDRLLGSAVRDAEERARVREIGETRRTLNTRDLSEADARDAALRDIISTIDYRRVLERQGYTAEAVAVKELMLRDTIRDRAAADQARKDREAQQAAEKAARDAERKKRQAELDAERAVTEPSVGQAVRFVVRGLWSTQQLADFLRAEKYDDVTIAALVDDALLERDEYLDAEARRQRAEAKAARTALSLAQLEAAVLQGVLTVGDYTATLRASGFTDADVDVLGRTLAERLKDRAALEARRKQIDTTAAGRGLSLAQAEQAVLRGIGTLGQFDAWLQGQGFVDFDRTVLVRLLEAKLADERAAVARRTQQEAAAAARAVPLAEIRRAVLVGVRPIDVYQAALIEARVDARDQALLLDLLRAELTEQAAAAEARAQAEARRRDRRFSIAQLEALVRASLLTPDDYRRELERDGWDAQERERLVALLLQQIEDEREIPEPPAEPPTPGTPPRPSLELIERAVRAGLASLSDYAAAVAERGYSDSDARLLVGLLTTRLEADRVAEARRAQLLLEVPGMAALASSLERAVRARVLELDDYRQRLIDAGVDPTDAAVLVATVAGSMRDLAWAAAMRDRIVAARLAFAAELDELTAAYSADALTRDQVRGMLIAAGLDLVEQTAVLLLLDEARAAAADAAAAAAEG